MQDLPTICQNPLTQHCGWFYSQLSWSNSIKSTTMHVPRILNARRKISTSNKYYVKKKKKSFSNLDLSPKCLRAQGKCATSVALYVIHSIKYLHWYPLYSFQRNPLRKNTTQPRYFPLTCTCEKSPIQPNKHRVLLTMTLLLSVHDNHRSLGNSIEIFSAIRLLACHWNMESVCCGLVQQASMPNTYRESHPVVENQITYEWIWHFFTAQ